MKIKDKQDTVEWIIFAFIVSIMLFIFDLNLINSISYFLIVIIIILIEDQIWGVAP